VEWDKRSAKNIHQPPPWCCWARGYINCLAIGKPLFSSIS
jgi:hypothetical protein